jgi:hypothetical protein
MTAQLPAMRAQLLATTAQLLATTAQLLATTAQLPAMTAQLPAMRAQLLAMRAQLLAMRAQSLAMTAQLLAISTPQPAITPRRSPASGGFIQPQRDKLKTGEIMGRRAVSREAWENFTSANNSGRVNRSRRFRASKSPGWTDLRNGW